MSDDAFIEKLGGTGLVAKELGLDTPVVSNWRRRGIPWRYRARLAQLAAQKGVVPESNFLDPERGAA